MVRYFIASIKTLFLCVICLTSCLSVAEPQKNPVRMGIISLASPATTFKQWQAFAEYLGQHLNREIEIVVPKGFKKIQQSVVNQSVDIFFINSYIFFQLKQQGLVKALAQMQNTNGSVLSHSVLFVRSNSGIDTIEDMKGQKVAFVSPVGAGGYLAPRATLYKEGIKTSTQTDEEFTGNLSSSIHKVLLGDVKLGTMCEINYKLMSQRVNTGDIKIIAKSEKYPEALFGARIDLPEKLHQRITSVMLGMTNDADGLKILKSLSVLKIKKFVAYDESIERLTKKLIRMAEFTNK